MNEKDKQVKEALECAQMLLKAEGIILEANDEEDNANRFFMIADPEPCVDDAEWAKKFEECITWELNIAIGYSFETAMELIAPYPHRRAREGGGESSSGICLI
jgi:hypothetical protein